MKTPTLFSRGLKYKPRNKQAAMIVRPAIGMHLPPDEIKEPIIVGTLSQRAAQAHQIESASRLARIQQLTAEECALREVRDAKAKAMDEKKKAQKSKTVNRQVRENRQLLMYLRRMERKHGKSGWKSPLMIGQ